MQKLEVKFRLVGKKLISFKDSVYTSWTIKAIKVKGGCISAVDAV